MQEVVVIGVAIYENMRVHALFSDQSSVILQEGLNYGSHYENGINCFRFSIENVPNGSQMRVKVRKIIEIVNNIGEEYVYIKGIDNLEVVEHKEGISVVGFNLGEKIRMDEDGYSIRSSCGRMRVTLGMNLFVVGVEYEQFIDKKGSTYNHLRVAKQYVLQTLPSQHRIALCLIIMGIEQLFPSNPIHQLAFLRKGKELIKQGKRVCKVDELRQECEEYGFYLEEGQAMIRLPGLKRRDCQYRYDDDQIGISIPARLLLNYHQSRMTHLFYNQFIVYNCQNLAIHNRQTQSITQQISDSIWKTYSVDGSILRHNVQFMDDHQLLTVVQMSIQVIQRTAMYLEREEQKKERGQEGGEENINRLMDIDDDLVERIRVSQGKGMKQIKCYFYDQTVVSLRQERGESETRVAGMSGEIRSETQPYDCLQTFRRQWKTHPNLHIQKTIYLWEQVYLATTQLQQEHDQMTQTEESVNQQLANNERFLCLLKH